METLIDPFGLKTGKPARTHGPEHPLYTCK